MDKSCEQCYWKFEYRNMHCVYKGTNETGQVCDKFLRRCECGDNEVEYEYNGEQYCFECIKNELGIKEYEIKHYITDDGEYLGDEDEERIYILTKCDSKVKEIDNE